MDKVTQPLWSLSEAEAFSLLRTGPTGLSEGEAQVRLKKYGTNVFHTKEKIRPFSILLKQFLNPLIFLLVAAAILTGILREGLDTTVIIFAILLNVLIGFFQEYHAENTLDKLTTYIKDRARVIREGKEEEIDSSLLVPGDILKLSYGSRIPADARIISDSNFKVDEAILTGESTPVEKSISAVSTGAPVSERIGVAHAGSLVVEGYATAVVFATGNATEIGRIAGVVSQIKRVPTPLQAGVKKLAWLILIFALVIVAGIFALGISRGESIISMLILSAAVAVGAVPEALPISLTVILAIGAERIANKKGIVRKLTAAETLGSATMIMTDKTGTLTLADMRLEEIKTVSELKEDELLRTALGNLDVSVENPDEEKSKWTFRGRPFEVNMVKAARTRNVPLDSLLALSSNLILPFNSTNKFSVSERDEKYVIMGAPEILLRRSDISKEEYVELESWINATSREGKRIIGLAMLPKSARKKTHKHFSAEEAEGLTLLGMFVFFDPIRPEVPGAIKNIESHGVKTVLVSGDLVGTAIAVAKSLDWKVAEDEVLSGEDLRKFSDPELLAVLPKIKIFARVTPEDKLRIGELYRSLGEVVAMTGDGVNDAPALKAMDIGISLGSGSDVAKSAADLVLLDDNFKTITASIDEGRRILSNVRKSFVFLMSTSLDEVLVVGGSLLFALPFPLSALQIIWVNLFTGSLPALAFAFEEYLDREKYSGKNLNLIFSPEVKALAFGVGITSSVLLFLLYFFLIKMGVELELARSVFFVCFSSYILFTAFCFRSLYRPLFSYKIFGNKKLNLSIVIALLILILTMTVPTLREVFGLAPLPLSWIPFILIWIVFNISLVEATKYILHKAKHVFPRIFAQKN